MTLTKSQKQRRAAIASKTAKSQTNASLKKMKGTSKKSIPAAYAVTAKNFDMVGEDSRVVPAQAWLTTVSVPIVTKATVVFATTLNPATLIPNSRLAKYAQLYEKFLFEELEFEYVPNVGTNQQGSLFMAVDADPDDTLSTSTGISLLNMASSVGRERFKSFPVYGTGEPLIIKVKGRDFFPEPLFVDPSKNGDRWALAGQFIVGTTGAFASALEAGYIIVRAKVRFMVPALESPQGAGGFAMIWGINNPTGTLPWGTPTNSNGNLSAELRTTNPSSGSSISSIIFNDPGVYYLNWYQQGSALSAGTLSFGGGASAYPTASFPVTKYANQTLHPGGTETIGMWLVNVPTSGGFVTYTSSGTHSNSSPAFVQVLLTPWAVVAPSALLESKLAIASLKQQMSDLERQMKASLYVKKALPMAPGEEFQTTTSGSVTGNIKSFNSQDLDIEEATSSTSETIGTALPDLSSRTRSVKSLQQQVSESPKYPRDLRRRGEIYLED